MLWRRNNRRDYWRYVGSRVLGFCGPVGEAGVFIVHLVALCLPWTATSREARREAKESAARERYWNAMEAAVRADDVDAVRQLLNAEDSGEWWMCKAAYWGCPSVIRFLASRGTDPNAIGAFGLDCEDVLPIMQAVYGALREGERLFTDPVLLARRLETISTLLALGANVNCNRDWRDRLPLRVAVDYGGPEEMVRLLLDAGGRVRMPMDWRDRSDRRLTLAPEESRRELERYESEGGPAMFAEARRRAAEAGQAVILYHARSDDGAGQSGGEARGGAYYAVSDSPTMLPGGSVDWWEWWYPDGTRRTFGPVV